MIYDTHYDTIRYDIYHINNTKAYNNYNAT